jgi:hypothetical protein
MSALLLHQKIMYQSIYRPKAESDGIKTEANYEANPTKKQF